MNTTKSITLSQSVVSHFWEKVVKSDDEGCWSWSGAHGGSQEYGILAVDRSPAYAHRVSWVIHNGPIAPGMLVLHRCDNPECTRPDHLWVGDQKANLADARAKGRLQNGNPYVPGHVQSPETRAKIGAASRARWAAHRLARDTKGGSDTKNVRVA